MTELKRTGRSASAVKLPDWVISNMNRYGNCVIDFISDVFAATAALLPFVKSERFAYWKGKAIQKGRTL